DVADKLRLDEAREQVDLRRVVHDVADELLASARCKRQDFGLDLPDTPITVEGVSWLIHQALSNMVHNAITYSPARARITVSVFRDGQSAILQVEDNGPGMSPEDMALAGHRFRRGASGKAQN